MSRYMYCMNEFFEEFDEIYKPSTIGELMLLTRMIIDKKRYLLIENKDEQPILVDIRTASAFSVGIDLINDQQYNRLTEFFDKYGAIRTINEMANTVWNTERS